jgi:large subunit ribosomal protein L13
MTQQNNLKNNIVEIDVSNQSIGRIATVVAGLLMDKDKPSFEPYKPGTTTVLIKNIKDVKFTGKKFTSKIYYHYSGYPGGLIETPLEKLFNKNPEEVLRRAVYGMLPKNKLRDVRIKRLTFVTE